MAVLTGDHAGRELEAVARDLGLARHRQQECEAQAAALERLNKSLEQRLHATRTDRPGSWQSVFARWLGQG